MGRFDSAEELAKELQRQRSRPSDWDMPFVWAQKPKCWVCKRDVDWIEERVDPKGNHIIRVKCHGQRDDVIISRQMLEVIARDPKGGIEQAWAFKPKGELEDGNGQTD